MRKTWGKVPLGRPRRKWEGNVSSGNRIGAVGGWLRICTCEHGNTSSVSVKWGGGIHWLDGGLLPITRPGESYRVYVIVTDLETSTLRQPSSELGCCAGGGGRRKLLTSHGGPFSVGLVNNPCLLSFVCEKLIFWLVEVQVITTDWNGE
jgi:hypothetical protein